MSGLDQYCSKAPTCTGCGEEHGCDEKAGRDMGRIAPAGLTATFLLQSWVEDGRVEARVAAALDAFPKDSLPHTAEYRLERPCWTVAYLGTNAGQAALLSETYRTRLEALLADVHARAIAEGIIPALNG